MLTPKAGLFVPPTERMIAPGKTITSPAISTGGPPLAITAP
jgi:hypothetical protein